jgi:hypothetical protein
MQASQSRRPVGGRPIPESSSHGARQPGHLACRIHASSHAPLRAASRGGANAGCRAAVFGSVHRVGSIVLQERFLGGGYVGHVQSDPVLSWADSNALHRTAEAAMASAVELRLLNFSQSMLIDGLYGPPPIFRTPERLR